MNTGAPRFQIVAIVSLVLVGGCATSKPAAPTTQMATDVNPIEATPAYWLDQPAVTSVESRDFDKLWSATDRAARDRFFVIDRADYRSGLMTTQPLVSSQFFEPWRRDTVTFDDTLLSSLATIRRTLRFEFTRQSDGSFQMIPKVLVERQVITERRITSTALYTSIYDPGTGAGTRESDIGLRLDPRYWYAIGRDDALERKLAADVRKQVSEKQR
jgi:hypothetical protein